MPEVWLPGVLPALILFLLLPAGCSDAEAKRREAELRAAVETKDAAVAERRELESRVEKLEAALSAANASLADARSRIKALEGKNVLPAPRSEPPPHPVKGLVLASDPGMDIYLVSVGEKDGVRVADELTVFRGDQFVAVVVVDRVFADKASVVLKKMNGKAIRKSDIKQGDRVANVL